MNEIQLFTLIRSVLLQGFAATGRDDVRVKRNYASTKSAAPAQPAIIMHRIGSSRVGWQSRNFRLTETEARDTNVQNHAISFQFNALVPTELEDSESLTANDLLDTAAMILQSRLMLDACKEAGIGIQHIGEIRSNYVQDENDNWEPEPSFDIIVVVKKELIISVGVVTSTGVKIYPV